MYEGIIELSVKQHKALSVWDLILFKKNGRIASSKRSSAEPTLEDARWAMASVQF